MSEKSPSAPPQLVTKEEPETVQNPVVVEAEPLDKDAIRSSSFTGNIIEQALINASSVYVTQKPSRLEGFTCGCIQIQNEYVARQNDKDGEIIFTAKEKSGFWERCCCSPHHSMMIHVKDPNDEDMFTLERQGCCKAKPFLCCCPWMDCCTDEIVVHKGRVEGLPGETNNPHEMFSVKQSRGCEGHLCKPQAKVFTESNKTEPETTITGPMVFGGLSEFIWESRWEATSGTSLNDSKGHVTKLVPRDMEDAFEQLLMAKDTYKVDFNAGITAKEKASMLVGALLIDYMYFEREKGAFTLEDGKFTITCCNCYCMGCLCPCSVGVPLGEEKMR